MVANPDKQRIGLALSGGGTRGYAHIGVLQALEDNGIRPDILSGTSIGAFAAALYAFGVSPKEMRELTEGMAPLHISKLKLSRFALFSNGELGRIIKSRIGRARIEDSPIPLAIIAVDIEKGEKVILRQGEVDLAVTASNAVPGIYRPITIDGRMLVDGGIAEDVPISPLRPMGADIVVAVNLSAERQYSKPDNIIDVILNAFEVAIDEDTKVQVRAADVLIEPRLSGFLRMDVSRIDELIAEGYRSAKTAVGKIRNLLEQPRELRPSADKYRCELPTTVL